MKWGYKQGVASIKTLDNLLRFRKYREDFNQGREQDTAASVHDVFLFIINFFLVKFCIQDPRHCTVIYYQQFLTMFSIRKSDFLSTSAQSVANLKVQGLPNIFYNERTWQWIKWLLHSVKKEISESNIVENSKMVRKFILRNNSYMMVN